MSYEDYKASWQALLEARARQEESNPFKLDISNVVAGQNARLSAQFLKMSGEETGSSQNWLDNKCSEEMRKWSLGDIVKDHESRFDQAYTRSVGHRCFVSFLQSTSEPEHEPWAGLSGFLPAAVAELPAPPANVPLLYHLPIPQRTWRAAKRIRFLGGCIDLSARFLALAALCHLEKMSAPGKKACTVCIKMHNEQDFHPWMLNRDVRERPCKKFLRVFHRKMGTYKPPARRYPHCHRCGRYIWKCPASVFFGLRNQVNWLVFEEQENPNYHYEGYFPEQSWMA